VKGTRQRKSGIKGLARAQQLTGRPIWYTIRHTIELNGLSP
jgi:hypothetical protein